MNHVLAVWLARVNYILTDFTSEKQEKFETISNPFDANKGNEYERVELKSCLLHDPSTSEKTKENHSKDLVGYFVRHDFNRMFDLLVNVMSDVEKYLTSMKLKRE